MTPDEHYREVERLLAIVDSLSKTSQVRSDIIAEAQVHATLATIYRSTERLVEK